MDTPSGNQEPPSDTNHKQYPLDPMDTAHVQPADDPTKRRKDASKTSKEQRSFYQLCLRRIKRRFAEISGLGADRWVELVLTAVIAFFAWVQLHTTMNE